MPRATAVAVAVPLIVIYFELSCRFRWSDLSEREIDILPAARQVYSTAALCNLLCVSLSHAFKVADSGFPMPKSRLVVSGICGWFLVWWLCCQSPHTCTFYNSRHSMKICTVYTAVALVFRRWARSRRISPFPVASAINSSSRRHEFSVSLGALFGPHNMCMLDTRYINHTSMLCVYHTSCKYDLLGFDVSEVPLFDSSRTRTIPATAVYKR